MCAPRPQVRFRSIVYVVRVFSIEGNEIQYTAYRKRYLAEKGVMDWHQQPPRQT